MSSPYTRHKAAAWLRAMAGLAAVLLGMQIRLPLLSFVLVIFGVLTAARHFTRLIRIWSVEQKMLEDLRGNYAQFHRASLPRQVFWLLFAIAEVDGRAEAEERELVRRFLLERFVDPITAQDLNTWEAQKIPTEQIGGLAATLRRVLNPAECETIFFWCCQITFADRSFKPDEHAALQMVSRGLGIEAHHAHTIFHHAKARFLGASDRPGSADGSKTWGRATPRPPTERQRALATLGLDESATPDDIRKRHRELVKRYHPDAHNHLGAVAAEDAARRFREIQQAYELLRAS